MLGAPSTDNSQLTPPAWLPRTTLSSKTSVMRLSPRPAPAEVSRSSCKGTARVLALVTTSVGERSASPAVLTVLSRRSTSGAATLAPLGAIRPSLGRESDHNGSLPRYLPGGLLHRGVLNQACAQAQTAGRDAGAGVQGGAHTPYFGALLQHHGSLSLGNVVWIRPAFFWGGGANKPATL